MDIPGMNKKVYTRTENFLGEMMKARLAEEMSQAAKQEREHAIETNDYHQGVPAIGVVGRCRLVKAHTQTLIQCQKTAAYTKAVVSVTNIAADESSGMVLH